ncbi:MAG TPA: hypothetical protein VMW65_16840 [Chloroflexota bacterium]|nr:hypothetical protein [Chloroflexota bacterium]
MESEKPRRLSAAETRRLIDDYTLYRFGHVLSAHDFAKQAGVSNQTIDDLLAQKQISDVDLSRIARSIDISPELLQEIARYCEMGSDMLHSLEQFFKAVKPQRAAKHARAA